MCESLRPSISFDPVLTQWEEYDYDCRVKLLVISDQIILRARRELLLITVLQICFVLFPCSTGSKVLIVVVTSIYFKRLNKILEQEKLDSILSSTCRLSRISDRNLKRSRKSNFLVRNSFLLVPLLVLHSSFNFCAWCEYLVGSVPPTSCFCF